MSGEKNSAGKGTKDSEEDKDRKKTKIEKRQYRRCLFLFSVAIPALFFPDMSSLTEMKCQCARRKFLLEAEQKRGKERKRRAKAEGTTDVMRGVHRNSIEAKKKSERKKVQSRNWSDICVSHSAACTLHS